MADSPPVGSPQHSPGMVRKRECGSHCPRWFVVQTHPREESRAQREILNQGIPTFLPMVAVQRRRAVELVALFPGYLFVLFDLARDRWRPIASTRGVQRIMGAAPDRPTAVPAGIVEHLLKTQDLRSVIRAIAPIPIPIGSTVRIGAGPFADQAGICLWSDDRRVRLLMEILGGSREIEVARSVIA